MIVLDANILLYAYDANSPFYRKARTWLEQVFSGSELVGIPWQTIGAFLRIATNPILSRDRLTAAKAIHAVDAWLALPNVKLLSPGDEHWPLLKRVIVDGQARAALITDAQLAALTMEYGGVLYTADRDFARFSGLRWKNPLD